MKFLKPLILILAVALLMPVASAENQPFSDLTDDSDYLRSIMWMHQNGVVDGYPDGTFKPDKCVNRAEFLKMMFELNKEVMLEQENPFNDVYETEWYYPYVSNAYNLGIINGYSDGSFKPGQCVNRVEAIKMAVEGMGIEIIQNDATHSGFEDVSLDVWYADYLYTAAIRNIVGMLHTENRDIFGTAEGMSRKEVAEMLYRINTMQNNGEQGYYEGLYPDAPTPVPAPLPDIDDDPMLGNPDAPITIIEFSDYECPACGTFHQTIFPLVKEAYIDTDIVNYVYRDFPLSSIHPNAVGAAIAANCAGDQGGDEVYFDYSSLLFSSRDLGVEIYYEYAEQLELNADEFSECLSSDKYLSEVENDAAAAAESELAGTPTFFINGEMIFGVPSFESLSEIIDDLISQ